MEVIMNGLIKFLLFLSISIAAIPVQASWFARGAGLLKNRLMQSTLALAGGYTSALLAHQAFASQHNTNTQTYIKIRHIAIPEYERCRQEIAKKLRQEREEAIEDFARWLDRDEDMKKIVAMSDEVARRECFATLDNETFSKKTDEVREKFLKKAQKLYADFDEVKGAIFGFDAPKIKLMHGSISSQMTVTKNAEGYCVHIGSGFIDGRFSAYFKGVLAHEFGHIINGDLEEWWDWHIEGRNNWITRHKKEYRADRIAVEAGYGDELKGNLQKLLQERGDISGPHSSHPKNSARIALINYYLKAR